MVKRLAIIDGKSVFYRGYYAMPNLSTDDGTPTGGVYGFAALSIELIKKLKPDYVCVAWDKAHTNIRKRLEIWPEYKAGRKPAPPDFYAQIPILHELLDAFSWPFYELDDYEADDIMATLARKASKQGIETCLITSDLDALQAIDPLTHVYAMKKGLANIEKFDPEHFQEKYGIRVDQFLDLKALKGDSSDNIPGVPGIGEKTAVQLLQQFDNLDNIYDNLWQTKDSVRRKLEAGHNSAIMSKKVAQLWFDAPIELDLPDMDIKDIDAEKLRNLLNHLEFRSLIRQLPSYMQSNENTTNGLTPAEVMNSDGAMKTLLDAKEIVVWPVEDILWVSPERGKVARLPIDEALEIIQDIPVIGHDCKPLLKTLLSRGVAKLPQIRHDTAQGSFLLNPLRRSRNLSDLAGVEALDPATAISALWTLYEEQSKAFDELPKLAHVARAIDFPLIPVLARMEWHGIKLDRRVLDTMNDDLTREITDLKTQMHEMVGYEFNISSPAQLSEVLFTKLQLPTTNIKKGKSVFSTRQQELDKLRGQHPIIELIERYRELVKLQNTYVEALPKLVDSKGYIHTTFNQDIAATGRLSSSDPNLQNIPIRTKLGRHVRDAFIPAPGNIFVNADYSQFELRLAAVLAPEPKMINDFNAGTDIHAKTASEVYGIPLDDVSKTQRRAAKVINFGILYGMSPHGLAAAAEMSFPEAKRFIDEYFRIRPNIRRYIDDTIKKAHDEGYVETLMGRRRPTPDVRSSNFAVRHAAERAAANMPIQGTEADLMKLAMLRVEERLPEGAWQVLQIHDSILVECARDQKDLVSEILVETMEQVMPDLGVSLQVDVKCGENWGEI